ncbi:hypothetical protein [Schaalia vaccimaxillae]|uniref:hypothetical protein n=1 Tax=Schaalia vaccimaxillae TaxID=183916 RepID=UPI0003B504D1|nr:hypothetical protein [Schaalia vaccimaxillae]
MSTTDLPGKKPWWRSTKKHFAPGPGRRVVLHVCDLSYWDEAEDQPLLANVTVGFRSHTVTALVDEDGAASDSLLLLLAGLADPTQGHVIAARPRSWRMRTGGRIAPIAHIYEGGALDTSLTVRQCLVKPLASTGVVAEWNDLEEAIDLTGLRAHKDTAIGALDDFSRIKVQIAAGLACGAQTFLVEYPSDVPADSTELFSILSAVAAKGAAVVVATMSTEVASLCDRTVVLVNGTVAADLSPADSQSLARVMAASLPAAIEAISTEETPPDAEPGTQEDIAEDAHAPREPDSVEAISDPDPLRAELIGRPIAQAVDPEVDEVIGQARKILSDLPGPVVPED